MGMFRMLLVLGALTCAFAGQAVGQTIKCSSDDGGKHYCKADTRNGVTMSKQISGAACQLDYSWGYDDRGVWVDHGCRAEFTLQAAAYPGASGKTIYCASDDGGKHYCQAETHAGVAMVKQRGGSACQQGYSWGFDDRGIWVDHGCRADFALEVGPQYPVGNTVVRCYSDDGRRKYCPTNVTGDVELMEQRSKSDCIQGSTSGYDGNGIWVDRGCRADFMVEAAGNYPGGGGSYQGRACNRSVGEARANELVQQCLQVSPATRPPCNAQNSCKLITDEIRRSCQMLSGNNAPPFCYDYR